MPGYNSNKYLVCVVHDPLSFADLHISGGDLVNGRKKTADTFGKFKSKLAVTCYVLMRSKRKLTKYKL